MSLCNVYLSIWNFYITFVETFKLINMRTNYLLPNQFKKIGWFLFIPSCILGVILLFIAWDAPAIPGLDWFNWNVFAIATEELFSDPQFFAVVQTNVLDEIISLLLIISAIFIAFSKEKKEDEYISKIRLESLVWATYVNYAVLALAIMFVYDLAFFWILVFNMFTMLLVFIIRFNWALYKSKKQVRDEE